MFSETRPVVVLVSPDPLLIRELPGILSRLDFAVQIALDGDRAIELIREQQASLTGSQWSAGLSEGVILLDTRLPAVSSGQLLASLHEMGVRQHWAIALIAEHVSDEWIARLRESAIDDIVPRQSDADAWKTHLSTMRRGHALWCELEMLRDSSLLEVQHDAITGTLNRDTMLTVLFRETDRIQRLHGALSLVVFDIDNFTRVNHELGRSAGDQLLREVGRRTSRILRTYDAIGRLGRDEFLLALPGCSIISAVTLAERMRVEVFGATYWVKTETNEIREVRLSACYGMTVSRGRSPLVVLREAEHALVQARLSGADSMHCSHDLGDGQAVAQLFSEPEVLAF